MRKENKENHVCVKLDSKYAKGLKGLQGFSHVQILWWANQADRDTLSEVKPYKKGPEELGIFATRSPKRPNPIAVSNIDVAYLDEKNGIIGLYFIDAFDGTDVLDIKPYTPSIDRIENPKTPDWCSHWPKSYEESGDYDCESELNF